LGGRGRRIRSSKPSQAKTNKQKKQVGETPVSKTKYKTTGQGA
jgi:hypothetical protein